MIHRDSIDFARSADLTHFGAPGYLAATLIDEEGGTHLVIANCGIIRAAPLFYPACPHTRHEQLGPLPPDIVDQIAAAQGKLRPPKASDE